MPPVDQMSLSRRERQIMDILIEKGESSAQEVLQGLPDAPSYSAVRALVARLVSKGIVEFRMDGNKHIYRAKLEPKKAQDSAVKRLLKTFFKGSRFNAVNALLDADSESMSTHELEMLERKIKQLRQVKEEE